MDYQITNKENNDKDDGPGAIKLWFPNGGTSTPNSNKPSHCTVTGLGRTSVSVIRVESTPSLKCQCYALSDIPSLSDFLERAQEEVSKSCYYWIDMCDLTLEEISTVGNIFGIHPLTVEDITQDCLEKVEIFESRGYMFCLLNACNNERVALVLYRDWVLTFHSKSDLIRSVYKRLEVEAVPLPNGSPTTHSRVALGPSWVLYSLLDSDVDEGMRFADNLVMEAKSLDQLVFLVNSIEQEEEDMLRRINCARIQTSSQKEWAAAKEKLMLYLLSPLALPFAKHQVQPLLRDVSDHASWCNQRLSNAEGVLNQSSSNYLTRISIEMARSANRTNEIMRQVAWASLAFVPYNLVAGIFGMNVRNPWMYTADPEYKDQPNACTPFYVIVGVFTGLCAIFIFFVFFRPKKKSIIPWHLHKRPSAAEHLLTTELPYVARRNSYYA